MVAVVVILAVVVLILGAALWASRSSLSAAESRVAELADRLETTEREATAAAADLSEARAKLEAERQHSTELASARDEAEARADKAERSAAEAEEARADAEARAERAEAAASDPLAPMALWALETVRLDRLWRDLVVPDPSTTSPLATTGDPSRSAAEIFADALREQSGTSIEVVWRVGSAVPPAPGAVLVRVVEELLAVARAADTGTLTVHDDGDDIVVVLDTDPPVTAAAHLRAALEAAGTQPIDAEDRVEVRVAKAGRATWEGDAGGEPPDGATGAG